MEDADFSDEFCRFLQSVVTTVDAAEVLLFLRRHRDESWAPAELQARLKPSANITEAEAAKYAESLEARGLARVEGDRRARYAPASADLAAHVEALAHAYEERPVTLIRMIYALRDGKIRTFADAFKLRGS